MGIADFFRPKYRHSDVRVRAEAVRALTADDAAILIEIARKDRDIGVRRLAMERIREADVLAEIAAVESERSLRAFAGERAARLWVSTACSDDADAAGSALTGMIKLGDQHALVEVVTKAELPAIRKRAFGELRDPRALADLAKSEAAQDLRTAAVARIDDGDVLRALAIDTTTKEIGLAAVEKIDDVDRLENVAQKAKNKAVRQKARKIVIEIEEAERAKKPGVSDEVKRRRAEKAQLVREVEAVAESFDFAKASEVVKTAEAAWSKLGAAAEDEGDGDDRFTRATERFWKRKELHDQQARGSDELRVVEREAQAERERRAREREARAVEAPKPAPTEEDIARDAETKAQRDKQRAEDDARRQAQAEERAARAKEDAERGVAIAASLEAMCADMEQLADATQRDTRAIDRVLSQAAKAFENVGKVSADKRDVLAERYRTARGKLVTKAGEMREAEDWQRWTNVPKAEALIATAKQMVEAPTTPDLGNRLRALQALWKEVGPMPQRRSKELWELFKTTCDQVYDKVKGFRAGEQEKFGEVAKVKEALIAEAEAIADSTDWAATADKLKALQARWKDSGYLPRKQGDELWKRFRAACDKFFERRKPMLDAQHAEEGENLARKQALISRAQAVADAAPGEGGWGKAITDIKELQRQWKDIGFVPRRDADAVWTAFRRACDSLFAKRDEARDTEANAHRAELDGVKAELEAVIAGGDDVVSRAIAVRAKARELGAQASDVDRMMRHVLEHHADAVKGTELDPAQARAKRDKLIAKLEELLPKQAASVSAGGNPADIASQLKQAMRQNAFGDLRFSGRDPIEVVDEVRTSWTEVGPILTDEDHAQAERFEATIGRVLAAAGAAPRDPDERGERSDRGNREERGGRRRRRDRHSAEQPAPAPTWSGLLAPATPIVVSTEPAGIAEVAPTPAAVPEQTPLTVVPDAAASAVVAISQPEDITAGTSVPVAAHDAITQPARLPPEVPAGVDSPPAYAPVSSQVVQVVEPPRRKSVSEMPPMDELDTGWDLGDDDPTASAVPADEKLANEPPADEPPSTGELAGDGAVDDSLDQVD